LLYLNERMVANMQTDNNVRPDHGQQETLRGAEALACKLSDAVTMGTRLRSGASHGENPGLRDPRRNREAHVGPEEEGVVRSAVAV